MIALSFANVLGTWTQLGQTLLLVIKKMTTFLRYSFFVVFLFQCFFSTYWTMEAKAPGDIIIGGIFPIHESFSVLTLSNWFYRLSIGRLSQSMIMVYAIEEVNKKRELGNITLGYHIVDSCGEVSAALENVQVFMRKTRDINDPALPPVLAVIGGYYSEICVSVTRQLNLDNIPEISYGATSGLLSDKNKFPSFMRTVPEDDYQVQVIIQILKHYNWNWVGVLTTDGEYGRYAIERLQVHADKAGICLAFVCILPESLKAKRIMHTIEGAANKIAQSNEVSVIISFAKQNHMMYIFDQVLQKPGGKGKVWVASDNWSQSTNVLNTSRWKLDDVGTVIGVTLKSSKSPDYTRFLKNLKPEEYKNNGFLTDFFNSSGTEAFKKEQLIDMTYPYGLFSIQLAVKAITQALKDVCIKKECNPKMLKPSEFKDALRAAKFSMDGNDYSFDEYGDINSGYEVIVWRDQRSSMDMNNIIGYFDIQTQKLIFNTHVKDIQVTSRCSEPCFHGTRRKREDSQPVCCYQCVPCPANHFSNKTDSDDCYKCNNATEYSMEGSDKCFLKKVIFLRWENMYHIVLLSFAALGALLIIIVGIIFLAHWNTPMVRSSVGPISVLLLLSLFCTFGAIPFFGGNPSGWQCQARQVIFGLSFTLCVSCILVKSFKILMAFEFDPVVQSTLEKLYKPYLIIPICMLGQVVICTVWLAVTPPKDTWNNYIADGERLKYCDERLFPAFGAMLAYIGLLAIICFCVAFKGRKLPGNYNEAKFITFAMLIYFISWIIFGPVYVTVTGQYLPAVEMVVILISAYGILFCHFFTKCYIILFRKEKNTKESFNEMIRRPTKMISEKSHKHFLLVMVCGINSKQQQHPKNNKNKIK
uniref:G-protein coupled receptor family C group 6 member A n=1 Tax=Oryzias latipes TaxID=8090 RepID=A0A3B3H3C4_ORYLA